MVGEDLSKVNAGNNVKPMIDHRPEDVRWMLEERKKRCDEEDLLSSFKVNPRDQGQGDRLHLYLHGCTY
jgi:hypothetical protein